jgi:hypothetical protein
MKTSTLKTILKVIAAVATAIASVLGASAVVSCM